jgi:hypothetical protein
MKALLSQLLLFVFLIAGLSVSNSATAQGVTIPLETFDLKLDSVNALIVRPVGAPFRDSSGTAKVTVYYELKRKSGKTAETGNWVLPLSIYAYVNDYVLGTVTESTIEAINDFFQMADLPELVAVLPEETEQEE